MSRFIGRSQELQDLQGALVDASSRSNKYQRGRCILIRGRRRVGKSTLVEEFIRSAGVPSLFFAASGGSSEAELEELLDCVRVSTLAEKNQFLEETPSTWNAAFRLLAEILPDDLPSIVVFDEVPYLMNSVDAFEGMLQRIWDRQLSRKPVLLLLIGSDLSMMEALNDYGRPFHQRGQEMVVGPLNPADMGDMLSLESAAAFDAALITGGLPLNCADWRPGMSMWKFLETSLSNPLSALLVSGERSLAAEFQSHTMSRDVLRSIGSGERTFTNIARSAGGIAHTTLVRAIDTLTAKGIIVAELPLSTRPSKEKRYRIADPYLRFWLTFIEPHMAEIERRRGDLVVERIRSQWSTWRGRAIEPIIRESLARILPDDHLPYAPAIGGYWTRSNDVETDIIGADRSPIAKNILFMGSIKWLERAPFNAQDLASLQKHKSSLSDKVLPLIAVSRSGVKCSGLDASYGPDDLIEAWS